MPEWFVRTPASSANLGAGFDVLGMAVSLYADIGVGDAPDDAQQLDEHHPGRHAFAALGGVGPMWMRCNIPMARGLGFSGAARVGAAALAAAIGGAQPDAALSSRRDDVLAVACDLEGHGDNAAASLFGGITAYIAGEVVRVTVGPTMAAAMFVAWVPDVTTSTDASRKAMGTTIELSAAVANIGRSIQFVAAFEHDDPALLVGAAADQMHQALRLPLVPDAATALESGVDAGAWAGWLSGSGPTVGFLCDAATANDVVAALPTSGHCKVLSIDLGGCRIVNQPGHRSTVE